MGWLGAGEQRRGPRQLPHHLGALNPCRPGLVCVWANKVPGGGERPSEDQGTFQNGVLRAQTGT